MRKVEQTTSGHVLSNGMHPGAHTKLEGSYHLIVMLLKHQSVINAIVVNLIFAVKCRLHEAYSTARLSGNPMYEDAPLHTKHKISHLTMLFI